MSGSKRNTSRAMGAAKKSRTASGGTGVKNGRSNAGRSSRRLTPNAGTPSAYEGNDIATGSQTPESIMNNTDVFDSGVAGGSNGDGGSDNNRSGS